MTKRLNVDNLAPEDIELTIDGAVYEVRGALMISEMIELMALERRITDASEEGGAVDAANATNAQLWKLIKERYPDAPMPELTMYQASRVLAFIASEGQIAADDPALPTVGAQVEDVTDREGITAEDERQVAESGALAAHELAREPGDQRGDEVPLDPPKSLQPRSSDLEQPTSGGRNGGEPAPGQPSDSTSETATAV